MQTVKMTNGINIPVLGFGTYQIVREGTEQAVINAIQAGYRHIDTAQAYLNETEVGNGIRHSGIKREEIFLTTKIWVENAGYNNAKASIERSLSRLGLEYIDLMLIHQPYGDVYGTWRALEEYHQQGIIRTIGVSNFSADRAVDLGVFNRVMPHVNQIEINPFHQRGHLINELKNEGIIPEAWAPFAEGKGDIFNNPVLIQIAEKYKKSVAQIIIRWLVEQEIVVLCKTTNPDRMKENLDIFDFSLSHQDKAEISKLDSNESQFINHASVSAVKWMATRLFNV